MRENTNIEKSGPGAYILLREFTVFNVHPFFWKKNTILATSFYETIS